MNKWRLALVSVLLAVPFLTLYALGSWFLWLRGLSLYVWLPLMLCMGAGFTLALRWQRKRQLLGPPPVEEAVHWTDRDRQAWALVEERAKRAATMDPKQLTDIAVYMDTARDMALELARFYHPGAEDPVSALTIPEVLAVTELASHDLAELADQYLPAGHLLRVKDWRRARQVSEWYQTASNVYWLVSAMFSPASTGIRFLTSKLGISRPWQVLQNDLIAWFYAAYVNRVGAYLIELNSGRLRVGAARYRELREAQARAEPAADGADVPQVALTVVGQVNVGKSSFVNALLGEQKAFTDILPATDAVTLYHLQPRGISTELLIRDTVGYGHAGPREDQLRQTEEAARDSDLIILVMHARDPARQADAELLRALRSWFAARPELRLPPVVGVLTHIDLLSPALEWQPPYDWVAPRRPKEQNIAEACAAAREQLGEYLAAVVPVCTAPGKVYGVEEWFLPALARQMDEAHAVAFLRCLRAEMNTGQVRKLLAQLLQAGGQAAVVLWDAYVARNPRSP